MDCRVPLRTSIDGIDKPKDNLEDENYSIHEPDKAE
jgi:hypothetical protein